MRNAPFPVNQDRSLSRVRRLVAAAIGAGLVLVLVSVAPASAQDDLPAPIEYGESGVESGAVEVGAGVEWLPVGGGDGGGTSCETWSIDLIVEDDYVQPVNRDWRLFSSDGTIPFTGSPDDLASNLAAYMRHFSPTGRWFNVTCDGVITVAAEGGPPVNVAALVEEAVDRVAPGDPEVEVAPAGLQVTQLPSWLAIDPTYWNAERRASASAGRVVVNAEVSPVEAIWDMGDGTVVTCDAGTVWSPDQDPTAAPCGHVYERTSLAVPGQAFEVSTTVEFRVDVTTSIPGASFGPFQLERQTVQSVEVGEIQAVNN